MTSRSRIILAIVLVLFPLLGSQLDHTSANSHHVYIAIGDSIAAGIGSSLPRTRSYPALIGDWITDLDGEPTATENLAVPGETATDFVTDGQLAAFQSLVDQTGQRGAEIRLVTVSLGGNEILNLMDATPEERETGLDAFRDSYREALISVRELVGEDVPIAATTYYDLTDGDPEIEFSDAWWIERFNQVIVEVAEDTGSTAIDLRSAFERQIQELTYYPIDVHPTNQGYRAIAHAIWRGIEFDRNAPRIDLGAPSTFTRLTPTLRVSVEDNVEIDTVTLELSDGEASQLIPQGDGRYISLLDLRNVEGDEVEISVTAADMAGNQSSDRETVAIEE
ncbi:MAG: SGNH/GDSL hydrolase family protein [Chloroflexota bacterium]